MDAEISLDEFEARLARNLAIREQEQAQKAAENHQLKELLKKKKLLLAGLKSFLSEFATENARLDAAISEIVTTCS